MTDSFRSPIFKAPGLKIKPKKFFTDTDIKPGQEAELLGKLDELISVIRQDNQIEKEKLDIEKKEREREKREKRENRIENLGKFFKGAGANLKKAAAPMTGFFDSLKRFLFFTILGGLITPLYNFLTNPENRGKIEATAKFLKDWWPALAIAAGAFLVPFKGLIIGTIAIATKGIIALGGLMLANPLLSAAVIGGIGAVYALLRRNKNIDPVDPLQRSRPENMNEYGGGNLQTEPFGGLFSGGGMHLGTDTVPAMLTPGEFVMSRGAVSMFGAGTMMAMNKAGGGTNRPKYGMVSGFSGGGFARQVTKLLENYEGLRLDAYPDPASGGEPITIGVGATRYPPGFRFGRSKVMMGDRITREEAYMIKDYDVKRHTQIAKDRVGADLWPKIPENVKFALISKAFNYGTLYNSTLRAVDEGIATGNYSALEAHYRNVLAKHNKGINSWRRNDEADVIATGKSNRSGMTFSTGTSRPVPKAPKAPPPVMPAGGSLMTHGSQYDATKLTDSIFGRNELGKFGKFVFDATTTGASNLFQMIKDRLPVDTPNTPVSNEMIVLPTIKADVSGTKTEQVDNSIPEFEIASGVQMRGLVGKALGIDDLVGV